MALKPITLTLISCLLLMLGVAAYVKHAIFMSSLYGISDFFRFYQATLFYFSGQDIYSQLMIVWPWVGKIKLFTINGNLNPPFLTLLLLPLHRFNFTQAFLIWNVMSMVLIVGSVVLALKPFPQWDKKGLLIVALFFMYLPNSQGLQAGQIVPLLLMLIVGTWLLARNHHDIPAGLLIGLACAIKLFCGLFLIYFLCLKRVRLLFSAFMTIIGAFLVSGCVFGFQSYLSYYHSMQGIHWYACVWNASFYGFFLRLFSNVEKNIPFIVAPHVAPVLTLLCVFILVAYLVWTWRKEGERQFDRGFSLVIVSMLLLSPLGWVYYFPLLLIPYLVLISESNDVVHVGACFLLLLSTLTGNAVRADLIKTSSQIFLLGGFGFYVLVALLVLLGCKSTGEKKISENLWILLYAIVFMPSLLSLFELLRNSHT